MYAKAFEKAKGDIEEGFKVLEPIHNYKGNKPDVLKAIEAFYLMGIALAGLKLHYSVDLLKRTVKLFESKIYQ